MVIRTGTGNGILPGYDDLRSAAEERSWKTDSPSPDHLTESLEDIGFPTERHEYVVLSINDGEYSARFLGEEDVEVPLQRSSIGGTLRGVLSRDYGPSSLKPARRPFEPAEEVGEEYRSAVRLLDFDVRELAEEYEEKVRENGGGLVKTYLVD
ncbi:MAG: hypothetical protein SVQ76_01060 [Candidatus Nanohaloarchaea archaeon]|nr:hypothetical protein [Candidatus Nanohaloarchaea archaeon]